jgi:Transcriptional regulator
MADKPSRKDGILQALALMLEADNNARITTAALARAVGVSEAALYRHFPSKAKIYEGLLDFAEETLFTAVNKIKSSDDDTATCCGNILGVFLAFGERNPGIIRLLCGDALHGEKERLQLRAGRIFERLESELKQAIRKGEVSEGLSTQLPPGMSATCMVNMVEGRLRQFVRTRYQARPTEDWDPLWQLLRSTIFSRQPVF